MMNDQPSDDRELSPVLREAYERAPETLPPSALLWRRTRAALHGQGLLRDRRSYWAWGGLAATIAVVAFVAGFAAGVGIHRESPQARAASQAAPATSRAAAERVQATGTDYSVALDNLARALEGASPDEIETGLQVAAATQRAQADARVLLLTSTTETSQSHGASGTPDRQVIWF